MGAVVGKSGRTVTALAAALGLIAGLLVAVTSAAVSTEDGVVLAADEITDDFDGANGDNPYNGGTGWPDGSSWVEQNDPGSPAWSTGEIRSSNDPGLEFGADDNGLTSTQSIERPVDLSAFTGGGAKISLTLIDRDNDEKLFVQFGDGADGYINVGQIGGSPDGTRVSYIVPPAALIANSSIRFISSTNNWSNGENVIIGDLDIEHAVPNPDLAGTCGIDIQAILDESGSIETFNAQVPIRDGVLAFLDGLENTGSRIRSFEFANAARDVQIPDGGSTALQDIVAATITNYEDSYFEFVPPPNNFDPDSTDPGTYEPGGGQTFTNWEFGVYQAATSGDKTPLYLLLTDGVPNTVGTPPPSNVVPPNDNADTNDTLRSANGKAAAVKWIDQIKSIGAPSDQPAKVIAVGVGQVGSGANLDRLAELVEPTKTPDIWEGGPGLDLSTVDVIAVDDFADLEAALAQAARNACSQQLIINKVDPNGIAITDPSVDFSVQVVGNPPPAPDADPEFKFLVPNLAAGEDVAEQSTGDDGQAAFEWSSVGFVDEPPTWQSKATITETVPEGFDVDEQNPGTCMVAPGGQQFNLTFESFNEQTRDAVYSLNDDQFSFAAGDIVTCSIVNVPKGELIIKKATTSASDNDTFGFDGAGGAIDGSITTANGQGTSELKATLDASGTYSVTEDQIPDGWNLLSASCDNGSGSLNSDTNTLSGITLQRGSPTICTFNNDKTSITIEKTSPETATSTGAGTYRVVYTIKVTNTSQSATTFNVKDQPLLSPGAEITGFAVTGPNDLPAIVNPEVDKLFYTENQPILPGAGNAREFTVTVDFKVDDYTALTAPDCNNEPNNGAYNLATANSPGNQDVTANDCADIPEPELTVEKTVTEEPNLINDTDFVVEYEIEVTNVGGIATEYDLVDTPDFVPSTIKLVELTPPGATDPIDITGELPDLQLATDALIGADEDPQIYKLRITFSINDNVTPEQRDCGTAPTSGQGTYNVTEVDYGAGKDDDDACGSIPDPGLDIEKEVITDPPQPVFVTGTEYTVTYKLTVTNDGPGATVYNVSDLTDFPDDAQPTNIAISGDYVDGDYNEGTPFFVTDQPIPVGTKEFTVVVTFDVPTTLSNEERECIDSVDPGGFGAYNTASVLRDNVVIDTDDDCADIPEPDLTPDKTVSTDPFYVGDGQWFLEYTITVTSDEEGGPAQYDLDDVTDFSPGVIADSLVFVSVDPNSIQGNINGNFGINDPSLATDVDISPGDVHTYVIGATVSTNYEVGSTYVPCGERPQAGEGLFNEATVTVNGEPLPPVDACEDLPGDLQMEKTDGGAIAIAGGAPFTYSLTVSNVGGGDTSDGQPITVTDVLPPEFEWVDDSLPDNCEIDGGDSQQINCDIDPDAVNLGGESTSFDVQARAPAGTTPSTEGYENLSYVTAELDPPPNPPVCPDGDSGVEVEDAFTLDGSVAAVLDVVLQLDEPIADPFNNVSCDRTPVEDAEIEVDKTDDVGNADTVENGEQYNYTIAVENVGTSTVEDVKIDDDLPNALTLVSINEGAGWTCNDSNPIACTYGPDLAPGETTTNVVVRVEVTESFIGTQIDNTVEASAILRVGEDEKEVTDEDTEVTPLEPTLDVSAFEPTCIGDAPYIQYDIVAKGFSPSGNATIEILDEDMNLIDTLNNQPLSGEILWPGASVVNGEAVDWPGWQLVNGVWVIDESDEFLRNGLFFRVTVNPTATTDLIPYPEASEACANPEQTSADLEILKAASTQIAPQGSSFDWILEVINNGPDLATEIVVTDQVPGTLQVNFVASETFNCDESSGNDVTCRLDELAVGDRAFIGINVTVPVGVVGNVPNTADVSGLVPDPNPNNNVDTDTVNVPAGVLPDTGSDMSDTLRAAGIIFVAGLALALLALRRRRDLRPVE